MTSTGNGMPSLKTFSQSIDEKKRTDEPDELEISQVYFMNLIVQNFTKLKSNF